MIRVTGSLLGNEKQAKKIYIIETNGIVFGPTGKIVVSSPFGFIEIEESLENLQKQLPNEPILKSH